MILLRQSTAGQVVHIGPIEALAHPFYRQESLSLQGSDIKRLVGGAAPADLDNPQVSHLAEGVYAVTLTAADTATAGRMTLMPSGTDWIAAPVRCHVYPAIVYDALVAGTASLDANVTDIEGTDASDYFGTLVQPLAQQTAVAALTAAVDDLENISAAQVRGQVDAGIAAAQLASAASVASLAQAVTDFEAAAPTAVLDAASADGLTLRQQMRLLSATLLGKTEKLNDSTWRIKSTDGEATLIQVTFNEGQRTAMALTPDAT